MNTTQRDDIIDLMNREEKYRTLAYRLAGTLVDEIHYSQTPSEDSLNLLAETLTLFPDSELANRYEELGIARLEPIQ